MPGDDATEQDHTVRVARERQRFTALDETFACDPSAAPDQRAFLVVTSPYKTGPPPAPSTTPPPPRSSPPQPPGRTSSTMPAPRKQSPNSPETDRQPGRAMTRAEALRWWRAGYQAGHQAAETSSRQQHGGTISSPATAPSTPPTSKPEATRCCSNSSTSSPASSPATITARPDPLPPQHDITAEPCQNSYIKRCRTMCRQRGR
jgi:hypothetical protein